MRLDTRKVDFIKAGIQSIEDVAEVYLFGSRVDDASKGGDIDILILSMELLDKSQIRTFRREFFKKFGWQKHSLCPSLS